jgi:hypothetical protein
LGKRWRRAFWSFRAPWTSWTSSARGRPSWPTFRRSWPSGPAWSGSSRASATRPLKKGFGRRASPWWRTGASWWSTEAPLLWLHSPLGALAGSPPRLVPEARPPLALAGGEGPLPHPGLRGPPPADPGPAGHPLLPPLPPALPHPKGPGRGPSGGGPEGLAGSGLLPEGGPTCTTWPSRWRPYPKASPSSKAFPASAPTPRRRWPPWPSGSGWRRWDGNVRRVLARFFALERTSPKALQGLAQSLMPEEAHPGEWNQALMELGATVCLPRKPLCGACPLAPRCRGKEAPERYPLPQRRKVREERLAALVLLGRKGVYLERLEGRFQGALRRPPFPGRGASREGGGPGGGPPVAGRGPPRLNPQEAPCGGPRGLLGGGRGRTPGKGLYPSSWRRCSARRFPSSPMRA